MHTALCSVVALRQIAELIDYYQLIVVSASSEDRSKSIKPVDDAIASLSFCCFSLEDSAVATLKLIGIAQAIVVAFVASVCIAVTFIAELIVVYVRAISLLSLGCCILDDSAVVKFRLIVVSQAIIVAFVASVCVVVAFAASVYSVTFTASVCSVTFATSVCVRDCIFSLFGVLGLVGSGNNNIHRVFPADCCISRQSVDVVDVVDVVDIVDGDIVELKSLMTS